jgi:hypothetical protein
VAASPGNARPTRSRNTFRKLAVNNLFAEYAQKPVSTGFCLSKGRRCSGNGRVLSMSEVYCQTSIMWFF